MAREPSIARIPRRYVGAEAPPPPPPGFFDGFVASVYAPDYRAIRDAQVAEAEQDAIRDAADRLIVEGVDPRALRRQNWAEALADRIRGTWSVDAVLAEVARRRVRDPKLFDGLETDAEKFRAQIAAPFDRRYGPTIDTAQRASGAAQIAGGLWAGASEPENVGTMFLGAGGKSIAETIINNMLLQVRVEAVSTVPRALEKAKRGEDTSPAALLAESAMAVGGAGLLTAAGEGVARGVKAGWPRMQAAVRERWAAFPEAVRTRWARPEDVSEADLPELAELAVGREQMTDDERAAVDLARQADAADAANPFVRNGAGERAHDENLADALERAMRDAPPAALSPVRVPRETTSSVPRTAPPADPAGSLKARIRRAESSGDDTARNPLSSATGRYQFVAGTWLSYYKRRFGETGESKAAILAKRDDPALQEQLVDDLIADNSAFLRRQGEAVSAGNLYLTHFAGQGGAKKLFDADPLARAGDVLGAGVVKANPWLREMSAGDVIAWAHRKMGQPVSPRAGARVELADPAADVDGRFQAELDRLEAERAALERGGTAEPTIAQAVDEAAGDWIGNPDAIEPVAVPEAGEAIEAPAPLVSAPHVRPPARALPKRTRPSDVIEYLADRGGVRDDEGHDLRHGRGMGKTFVPRAGPLLRPRGMTIDEAGELLHEAGFFADRPTTADVLDMIDRAVNQKQKFYAFGETEAAADMAAARQREIDLGQRAQVAEELYLDPDSEGELIDEVMARIAAGEDRWFALEAAVMARRANVLDRARAEAEDYADEWIPGFDDPPDGYYDAPDAARGGRRAAEPRAAQGSGEPDPASGADRGPEGTAAGLTPEDAASIRQMADNPEVAEAQARVFDDPDAEGARAQVESLEHDARMGALQARPWWETIDPVGKEVSWSAFEKEANVGRSGTVTSVIRFKAHDGADAVYWRVNSGGMHRAVHPAEVELFDGMPSSNRRLSEHADPAGKARAQVERVEHDPQMAAQLPQQTIDYLKGNGRELRLKDIVDDPTDGQRGYVIGPNGKVYELKSKDAHAEFAAAVPPGSAAHFASLTVFRSEIAIRPAAVITPGVQRTIGELRKRAVRAGKSVVQGEDAAFPAAGAMDTIDDLDAEGVRAQLESLEHDPRMDAEDRTVRLDAEGEAQSRAAMIQEIDNEAAEIEALRACLPPGKPAGGGDAE